MPGGHGRRARTRDMFSRGYRQKGFIPLTVFLRNLKVGQYVDIKVNAAQHKGMPHKVYHGRTGVIFNVTKRAVGVEVNKQVNNRIVKKRIHVRIEHVQPSRCREDFLKRIVENDKLRKEAKARGETITPKRQPVGPLPAYTIEEPVIETLTAVPYDIETDVK